MKNTFYYCQNTTLQLMRFRTLVLTDEISIQELKLFNFNLKSFFPSSLFRYLFPKNIKVEKTRLHYVVLDCIKDLKADLDISIYYIQIFAISTFIQQEIKVFFRVAVTIAQLLSYLITISQHKIDWPFNKRLLSHEVLV